MVYFYFVSQRRANILKPLLQFEHLHVHFSCEQVSLVHIAKLTLAKHATHHGQAKITKYINYKMVNSFFLKGKYFTFARIPSCTRL
jgi:hypothetical protein